jgi:hypothetical protein
MCSGAQGLSLPHAPARVHGEAALKPRAAEVPLACEPVKPRPPAQLPPPPAAWSGAQRGLSSEWPARQSPANVAAASGASRYAGALHRTARGQRPRAHIDSSCANASSASSDTPVGGHHSGCRRARAVHATDMHPAASAAYPTAAAAPRARATAAAAAAAAHAGGRGPLYLGARYCGWMGPHCMTPPPSVTEHTDGG